MAHLYIRSQTQFFYVVYKCLKTLFFQLLYLDFAFLFVAYLTEANLAQLRISVCC